MSVQRLSVLEKNGLDPKQVMLADFPEWGIVAFPAALIRGLGKGVRPDVTEGDGPAHAIVEDLTGAQKRRLAKEADWFVVPPTYHY